ncbi:hypothetical protein [Nocardiopsis rhodophaea]|uniref:hypothetical protein n=1 Tax=Nocardiopsis rhodophaea TaxID=280238 RepID=UPI0031DCB3E9
MSGDQGDRRTQARADRLRREIEELRVLVIFGKAYPVEPREPPYFIGDEVAYLEWQRDDIEWRRFWINKG